MAGIIYYNALESEALQMARSILGEGISLEESPRFIRQEEYTMDAIKELITVLCSKDDRDRVVYFPNAEQLTGLVQDALLKTIEDRDEVVFIFNSRKRLIPTIESRSRIYNKQRVGEGEFNSWLEYEYALSAPWLYAFTEGNKEIAQNVINDEGLWNCMTKLYVDFNCPMEQTVLLKDLGMMKEKDKESFFALHREYLRGLYCFMEQRLLELLVKDTDNRRVARALTYVKKHMNMIGGRSYSQNDFFDLLTRI